MADFVPVPADVDTPPQTQRKQRNQQGYYQAYQPSPEDQAYTNHLAAQTIEYLFSADNLAQDRTAVTAWVEVAERRKATIISRFTQASTHQEELLAMLRRKSLQTRMGINLYCG